MNMNFLFAIFALMIALVIIVVISKKNAPSSKKGEKKAATAKAILSANEQPMYFRLCEAFPSHLVLAQVSFSAMLHSRDQLVRNQFNRKTADFVLCTKAFEVVAILELDDSSHRGREEKDAVRDKLLTDAGYRVLRYKTVPDADRLNQDIATTM